MRTKKSTTPKQPIFIPQILTAFHMGLHVTAVADWVTITRRLFASKGALKGSWKITMSTAVSFASLVDPKNVLRK